MQYLTRFLSEDEGCPRVSWDKYCLDPFVLGDVCHATATSSCCTQVPHACSARREGRGPCVDASHLLLHSLPCWHIPVTSPHPTPTPTPTPTPPERGAPVRACLPAGQLLHHRSGAQRARLAGPGGSL